MCGIRARYELFATYGHLQLIRPQWGLKATMGIFCGTSGTRQVLYTGEKPNQTQIEYAQKMHTPTSTTTNYHY